MRNNRLRASELTITWLALLTMIFVCMACTPPLPDPHKPITSTEVFSATGDLPFEERWWTLFEDETLNGLINKAHQKNLTLQIAWNRLDRSMALSRQSRAGFFPTLSADASTTSSRTKAAGVTNSSELYDLGLAATYELDLWGRIRAQNQSANFELQATAEDLKTAYLTITAEVASTWYQLVEQYGQRQVILDQTRVNSQTLELITLQFRTGKTGIADVLQQRQLVERNRGELAQIKSAISLLENQLAILLAEEPGQLANLEQAPLKELPPRPATGLKVELLERRPDIISAWYSVLAANQQTRAAIADRFPKLTLGASAGSTAVDTANILDDWTTRLVSNLIAPIIDGGRRRAEVARNRALTEEAVNIYGQKVLQAIAEVEEALIREQRQTEYLESLEKQLQLAETATESIRDRYTKGAEDYQRVLTSILSQQNLQRSVLTARRQLYEYRIALYRALGGGWPLTRNAETLDQKT